MRYFQENYSTWHAQVKLPLLLLLLLLFGSCSHPTSASKEVGPRRKVM